MNIEQVGLINLTSIVRFSVVRDAEILLNMKHEYRKDIGRYSKAYSELQAAHRKLKHAVNYLEMFEQSVREMEVER